MPKHFVFLQLREPSLVAFLSVVSLTVYGHGLRRYPHITLRGPYRNPVSRRTLEKCRTILQHDVIRVRQVGTFDNAGEHVVYLGVDSPSLRKVWWKPDFPIEHFGFNPHISIYRGSDAVVARRLYDFFNSEPFDILCMDYELIPYQSKTQPLFSGPNERAYHYYQLIRAGRINSDFSSRLSRALRE